MSARAVPGAAPADGSSERTGLAGVPDRRQVLFNIPLAAQLKVLASGQPRQKGRFNVKAEISILQRGLVDEGVT